MATEVPSTLKGLIAETCEWNEEDVSSDDNEVIKVKALMAVSKEERVSISKECTRNGDWVQISIRKSQRNSTDPLFAVIDSSETEYDLADESSVCSTFFPLLEKPCDAKIVSKPKAISISTFKAEALKGIISTKPSSAPAQEKKALALKSNSAPAKNSKNMKSTNYLHLAFVIKELSDLKLQVNKNQIISLEIIQEILNTPLKNVKSVPVPSIPQLITMKLNGSKEKMKDGYGDGDVTIHPTQIFSVNNWELNPNHTERPPFTAHMLAICNVKKLVAFKAPRTTSQTEKMVSQGTKPRAKAGHKKQSTYSKQPPMSSSEATKGGSSKAPTFSKTYPSRKRKESSSAKDSNPSQPLVSTPLHTRMHKEDQQAAGGPTSLGVTRRKNVAKLSEEIKCEETKLEDLAKLAPNVDADFKDLDSLDDDPIIVVDDSEEDEKEDKNKEIHFTTNDKTKDISASILPSPRSIHIQELTNQVLLLHSQKHTLETGKTKLKQKLLD
nr:hypothetical protein [Tanacetum cinerariifolium]GEX39638.1 hypothetical protein [Tanacetum cinerariifolium]